MFQGKVCSMWTKCDCVSYEKFVVKCPPWQRWRSLLEIFGCLPIGSIVFFGQLIWFSLFPCGSRLVPVKSIFIGLFWWVTSLWIEFKSVYFIRISKLKRKTMFFLFLNVVSFIWSKNILIAIFISKFFKYLNIISK